MRDPETGRRVTRERRRDEWISQNNPELMLRPDRQGVVAELRGNLAVLLEEPDCRSNGAGRGI